MPPAHAQDTDSSVGVVGEHPASPPPPSRVPPSWAVAALAAAAAAGAVLGLASCLLLRPPCRERQDAPASPTASSPVSASASAVTPMLSVVSAGAAAGMGGMDRLRGGGRAAARELAASRDRQVRLHAVRTDLTLNLPPSIALPDGEEHRTSYSSAAASRLQLRDAEQESEIYQKCIRPPPNRTVMESESPPPYRSSSAGVLASCSSSSGTSSDWSSSSSPGSAPLVVRCHSMSSTSSTMISKPGAAGSSSSHHNASSQGGQKTDFLQRTVVKIFTGKKTPPTTTTTTSPAPCVNVPTAQAQTRHQPRRESGAGHRPPV